MPLSSISSKSWYNVTWCSWSTASVTSVKYALRTTCSCVRNSTTIKGSVSLSVVAMYVISPRVMWKQYCLPSVVSTSLYRLCFTDSRCDAKTLSSTAACGTVGPQCFSAHSDSVLLFTMNRLPMPIAAIGRIGEPRGPDQAGKATARVERPDAREPRWTGSRTRSTSSVAAVEARGCGSTRACRVWPAARNLIESSPRPGRALKTRDEKSA